LTGLFAAKPPRSVKSIVAHPIVSSLTFTLAVLCELLYEQSD
jgi:hypothetical protein